ncbi:MAG: helix-turn-helix transcriptional regulator [Bacteroidia bacterium]|nr:helix-turn-helix transcriptional regulator [Bacteroidia bacterium]
MEPQKAFDRIAERSTGHSKIQIAKALDISDQVHAILQKKGMDQKDLAKKLGKSESEVSKWLSGLHNLTLKSIAKMEAALGEDLILTPLRFAQQPKNQ